MHHLREQSSPLTTHVFICFVWISEPTAIISLYSINWLVLYKRDLTLYSTVVSICTARWSLYVPHGGHYMYHQFNIQQFSVLPTQCIYVFCVDLRTNSDYFSIRYKLNGFCNRDGVFTARYGLGLYI